MRAEREHARRQTTEPPEQRRTPPTPGAIPVSNQALARVLQRERSTRVLARDGFSGPSYARHGPPGSALEAKRSALSGAAASTQQVDNACLDATKKIVSSVQTLYAIGEDLDKRASEGWRITDDKDIVALAKDVKGGAKAYEDITKSIETLRKKNFDFSLTEFAQDPEFPSAMGLLKASVDSIAQAPETDAALAAFQANPNRQTANAWATAVGKQFSAAKSIAAALPFPPGAKFLQDYFVGLLGAPEAYIAAFQALVSYRYGELDKQLGIDDETHKLVEPGGGIIGDKTVWAGDGCSVVQQSAFVGGGFELYNWIKAHREIDGNDLWRLPARAVVALLSKGIQSDPQVTEAQRAVWLPWLTSKL